VPGLEIPAGTSRLQLRVLSRTRLRPALGLTVTLGGRAKKVVESRLAAQRVGRERISDAVFELPASVAREQSATICLRADDLVNWGGTPLPVVPSPAPPTVGGHPIAGRIAVWYLPHAGARRSFVAAAPDIAHRASLFRPRFVGAWLYWAIVLALLPALAFAAVRCLAVAAAGSGRRLGRTLFAIAAINFACWSLITPPFQAPDEVDHFAYTQSLVERGRAPARDAGSPLGRWSTAEDLVLESMSFFTDHQIGDTKVPWGEAQVRAYRARAAATRPSASDGGGNETAATHGPIYYGALAPAYALASSSPLDQLTLMRLTSALIGALTVLFAYLLTRELAPRRPWLAVLAALLVAFQPMYGFISGAVNNDVGVNATAAAVQLVLILLIRRGFAPRLTILAALLLFALPVVKLTGYSLYPVAAIAVLLALLRHHRRAEVVWAAGLVVATALARVAASKLVGALSAPSANRSAAPEAGSVVASATSEALAHPLGYLAYVWQVFLPRLSFMAPHFEAYSFPAFVIYVERGWGAFGWYDIFFSHWVYDVILWTMVAVLPLAAVALAREWDFVRRHRSELVVLVLSPIAVVMGVEAAFYTIGVRGILPEFGRYAFPAIVPLAVLVVASLHAFGRRAAMIAGTVLLVALLALSYSAQLVELTGFYA
jgi:hypothetical protein